MAACDAMDGRQTYTKPRSVSSLTKTDVRLYLWTVYGVKTTYIRTANYISPLCRTRLDMGPDMVDMNKIGHTDETTRDDSHVSSREQDVAGHVWRDKML
ncbi:hypothetical protein V8E55_004650 [Tylopilus felleus]